MMHGDCICVYVQYTGMWDIVVWKCVVLLDVSYVETTDLCV